MSDSEFSEAEAISTVDPDVVRRLPKVELHDHLDGGLRPQTIIDIAAETGYEGLPTTDAAELEKWFFDAANSGDLPTYLTTFDHTTAVMQTRDSLVRVTREAVEDLAADGVCYAELRYAPEQHQAKGLGLQDVVEATVQGVKEGERIVAERGGRIHVRLLLCAMRHADRAAEIAQLIVDNHGEHTPGEGYVVGFDIAGAEDGFPPSNHVEAFRILRENLVPVTVHAGEAAGVESIADGLRQGAVRIGHGVRIYEDLDATMNGIELGEVAKFVRDRRIPLEICPTSNTQTGVCDSVADHPFNLLYELGFTCTVNTDNRLVSGCTMTGEMLALAENFDLEYWQFLELTTNALDNAFCDQPLRESLEREVIYPAYAELGGTLGSDAGDSEGLGELHAEHGHVHGAGTEEVQLSMENLRAELAELGLSLDDDGDEDSEGSETPEDK
ncbi:adenosine deaminase [Corynebacterium sp. USCH3]|uniref:adenosine deaminase n=1 Tax=Corynebacterium sp. USCH3 TaxID=3024840 RepID=UPI0030B5739E